VKDEEVEKIKRKRFFELLERMGRAEQTPTPGKPIVVTDETFFDVLETYPLVLVDFWAEWCGPCHMVAPILEALAKKYTGKLVVAKLNVDKNPHTTLKHQIRSIPTLILFKNGQPIEKIVGAQPKHVIETKILKHIKHSPRT